MTIFSQLYGQLPTFPAIVILKYQALIKRSNFSVKLKPYPTFTMSVVFLQLAPLSLTVVKIKLLKYKTRETVI